jgi:hypothetical protein
MNEKHPDLEIRVSTIDGSTRAFVQRDPEMVARTLIELHPALIFGQDRLIIVEDDTEVALVSPLITRVDLVTNRLSVWDFPFVLGALTEVTEAEFMEGFEGFNGSEQSGDVPLFLSLEMVGGERLYLSMRVVAGVSTAQLGKVYSLLKERRLIFGLRTGGVGVLNISNLLGFSVHPEPPIFVASELHPLNDYSHDNNAAYDFDPQKQDEGVADRQRKSL